MPTRPLSRLSRAVLALALVAPGCVTKSSRLPSSGPAGATSALTLTDVARAVGLDFRQGAFRWGVSPDPVATMGSGLCWLDFDDDGWMDLFVVNSYALVEAGRWGEAGGPPRSALFRNVEGRFVDVSDGSGADLAIRGSGCVAADLDLDARTDLYVTSADGAALLWNEGDGTFVDGTEAAGVEAFGWHTGAAVGDVDGDGWPDLFVAGYADLNNRVPDATLGFPNTYLGVRDLLYVSDGPSDGGRPTFREVGREAGLEVADFGYGLGATFSDLDRDGDLDLYVANDTKPNRLYDNVPWPGGAEADPAGLGFRFEELAARAGAADPNAGMGVAAADYDGDGRTDLFVTNARGQGHAAYRGEPSDLVDPSFADVRTELGPDLTAITAWGVSWADLDLDTDLDLLIVGGDILVDDLAADAEQAQAFANLAAQGVAGRFQDRSADVGLDDVGPLIARGSATADYDNDGDLDIAVNTIGGSLVLLRNDGAVGNWLEVRLDGPSPGATVTALLPDGTELSREVHAGSSYLSSDDPRCHFGLGAAGEVRKLVVRWPGGEETVMDDVGANRILTVEAPG